MKKKNTIALIIVLILMIITIGAIWKLSDFNKKSEPVAMNDLDTASGKNAGASNNGSDNNSNMVVSFIDVGQADCILIESDSHFMLVDAGNNGDADVIEKYLNDQGVKKLDYVIGTHPHEDHIGSLDNIINDYEIGTVILPEVTTTTKTFSDVITAIEAKKLSITKPVVGDTYKLGNASFVILSPVNTYDKEYNNWSVGIKISNGNNSFVMCGDAETEAEKDILSTGIDISADVLKAGHHGSTTSSSSAFLKAVNPKYAVISVGTGNKYGHPANSTLDKFKKMNIAVFRTDKQGTIVAASDGNNIIWNNQPIK